MKQTKRDNIKSLLIMIFALSMLFVSFLGSTFAWFTGSDSINFNGITPIVNTTLYKYSNSAYTTLDDSSLTISYSSPNSAIGAYFDLTNSDSTLNTNIPTYVRARIVVGWSEQGPNGDPLEAVFPTVSSVNWYSTIGTNGSGSVSKDQIKNGWLYYKSAIPVSNIATKLAIFTSLTITNTNLVSDVYINIYVEAVQANVTGIQKFGSIPQNWPN